MLLILCKIYIYTTIRNEQMPVNYIVSAAVRINYYGFMQYLNMLSLIITCYLTCFAPASVWGNNGQDRRSTILPDAYARASW